MVFNFKLSRRAKSSPNWTDISSGKNGQTRGRDRAAQSLSARAIGAGDVRRHHSQKHLDDRFDRVGKTENARRLASLAQAPMLKVEATRFTEVGCVGRDVDSMLRDLTEIGVSMVEREKLEEVQEQAKILAEDRVLDLLVEKPRRHKSAKMPQNPFAALLVETPEEDDASPSFPRSCFGSRERPPNSQCVVLSAEITGRHGSKCAR